MAAIWPISLPQQFLQQGFSRSNNPQIITSDYDVGEPQTRPRSQYKGIKLSGSFRMDFAQQAVFDTFYNVTTISGTQPFEFPDPYDENNILMVKFDSQSPPTESALSGKFLTVNVSLIVQP